MRYRNHRLTRRPLAEINVVPYIDVMLVLLVIFMITAPLLTQGIHVNLPHTTAKALPPKKAMPIVVSVNARGKLFLNIDKNPTQPITAQRLMSRINTILTQAKKHHQKRDVYVKGDRSAHYGQVVKAMVLLQKASVPSVGLITQSIRGARVNVRVNTRHALRAH